MPTSGRRQGGDARGAVREPLGAVQVVLTAACNLACAYCFESAKARRRMGWGLLRRALDLALTAPRGSAEILFYGGEPLLERALLERGIEFVRRSPRGRRAALAVTTNGLLLDRSASAFLERHDVALQLSFDGIPPAQDLRGPGTFRELDSLLVRLAREQPRWFRNRVSIAMTLTPVTIPYLVESVRYFVRRGVTNVDISPVLGWEQAWRVGDIDALDRAFSRLFAYSVRRFRRTGEVPVRLFRRGVRLARRARDGPPCAAASGKMFAVDVDGKVYGCVGLAESYQEQVEGPLQEQMRAMRLGDLRDRSFQRRLRAHPTAAASASLFGPRAERYTSYGRCADCRHVEECVMCPVAAATLPGNDDPRRNLDFPCAFCKVALGWRERFPRPPGVEEVLFGRASVPTWLRHVVGPAANVLRSPTGKTTPRASCTARPRPDEIHRPRSSRVAPRPSPTAVRTGSSAPRSRA